MKQWVTWERKDRLAIITMNHPPANALCPEAMDDIVACLDEIRQDSEVRVVIMTAAGEKLFMGGADITSFPEMLKDSRKQGNALATKGHSVYSGFATFPLPVIAAANGTAMGGGVEVMLGCDIRVASPKAKFGLPEVKLGLLPGGGGTLRLPKAIGYSRALLMMLTGKAITAQEALEYGLVDIIAETPEKTLDTAISLANEIAQYPADVLKQIKKTTFHGAMQDVLENIPFEQECFVEVFSGDAAREGITAFLEKRPADYSNM